LIAARAASSAAQPSSSVPPCTCVSSDNSSNHTNEMDNLKIGFQLTQQYTVMVVAATPVFGAMMH
jgi:hypothetical protein